jgi:hypothetical protein
MDPSYFIELIDDKESSNFLGNLTEVKSPKLWWLDAGKRVNTKGCGKATLKLKTTQLPFKGGMNRQLVGLLKFVAHTSTIGGLDCGTALEDQDTHRTFGKRIMKKWNVTMLNVKMHMLITLDSNDVSKRSLDMGSKCFVTPKPWKYNERFKEFLQKNHNL